MDDKQVKALQEAIKLIREDETMVANGDEDDVRLQPIIDILTKSLDVPADRARDVALGLVASALGR